MILESSRPEAIHCLETRRPFFNETGRAAVTLRVFRRHEKDMHERGDPMSLCRRDMGLLR